MRVYTKSMYGRGTIFITPGKDHPESSEFLDPKSKEPIMLTVKFENGKAEVSDAVGKYLIANNHAQRNPVILQPEDVVEQTAQLDRLTRENASLRERLVQAGIAA